MRFASEAGSRRRIPTRGRSITQAQANGILRRRAAHIATHRTALNTETTPPRHQLWARGRTRRLRWGWDSSAWFSRKTQTCRWPLTSSAGAPPVERTQQARTREEYQPARRLRGELKPQHTDRSCGRVAAPARREPVDWRREGAAFTGWVAACRRVQRIRFDSEDLAPAREVNTLGTAFAPSDHRSQHPALGRSRRNRIVRRVAASFRAPAGANRGRQ
jgi:hypothetical protein